MAEWLKDLQEQIFMSVANPKGQGRTARSNARKLSKRARRRAGLPTEDRVLINGKTSSKGELAEWLKARPC